MKSICIIVTLAITSMLFVFIPLGIVNATTSLYSIPPTEEQEEIGHDENGKKLDYNECPGYDDGIDPSEYENMTIEELGAITDNVDNRVIELRAQGSSLDEDEQEELECLEAIRTIEENAQVDMIQTSNDLVRGLEAFKTLNELDQKYNFR